MPHAVRILRHRALRMMDILPCLGGRDFERKMVGRCSNYKFGDTSFLVKVVLAMNANSDSKRVFVSSEFQKTQGCHMMDN